MTKILCDYCFEEFKDGEDFCKIVTTRVGSANPEIEIDLHAECKELFYAYIRKFKKKK